MWKWKREIEGERQLASTTGQSYILCPLYVFCFIHYNWRYELYWFTIVMVIDSDKFILA